MPTTDEKVYQTPTFLKMLTNLCRKKKLKTVIKMRLEIHLIQHSDIVPFKNEKAWCQVMNINYKAKHVTLETQHIMIMNIILIVSQYVGYITDKKCPQCHK